MKKHLALVLVFAMLFSIIQPLLALAYTYDGQDFGSGERNDPVRYKDFRLSLNGIKTVGCPTAAFTIDIGSEYMNSSSTSLESDGVTATNPMYAKVGDIATISTQGTTHGLENSKPYSTYVLNRYDWQVTFRADGTSNYVLKESTSNVFANKSFTFDQPGTYNFYLNVRDSMPHDITENWGNWAINGVHESIGRNPGPTNNPTDDLYGYWYYAKVQVIVRYPTLVENHIDRVSGTTLNQVVHRNITTNTKQTQSKTFPGYRFIASREGYTWEELESCPDGTQTSRTSTFSNEHMTAFHNYYYEPLPGLFANFAIKYSNNDYTDKELTVLNTPVTANLEDLSVGDNITSWTWEYKTPDMPSFQAFSNTKNTTKELNIESTYTFKLTVRNATEQNSSTHYITIKKGTPPPPPSTGKPPIAVITGPTERMAGESITFSGASSTDPDGTIVNYIWNIPGSNHIYTEPSKRATRVWYPEVGEYDLDLTVVDNDGLTGDSMTSIKITPPIPVAAIDITGKLKENRRITVSGANSFSPTYYPINKYTWTMTNGAAARYIGTFGSDASKDMLLKKAQVYSFNLRVDNTYGLSDTESKSITIAPDVAPTADFSVAAQILRNPNDSNYSTITVINNSKSTDGDTIKKTVLFYSYDSDNDGNFDEEVWYMSKDGTTWTASGLTYANLNNLDLYNLAGASNPTNFVLKTKHVGKYKFEAKTIEDIAAADTIPSLLTASDYKTGITTTEKPLSAKIVEVINTAPQITFEAKKKKEADVFIFTDYTGAKLDSLKAVIDVKKSQLIPLNVDANFIVVNNSKTIGTQSLKKYRFYRNWFFNIKVTEGSGTNLSIDPSNPYYVNHSGLWEERIDYDKPLNEIPIARPYSHYVYRGTGSYRGYAYERDYVEYRFYDTIGGYLDMDVTTYYNNYGFYRDYNTWSIIGAGVDTTWTRDTYISTDTFNVTSIDLTKIQSLALRPNSDRYAFFLSDAVGNDYSGSFGTAFAFGDLTDTVQNYLKGNNFRISVIAPNTILDANLLGEKVTDIVSTGYYGFYTSFDGKTKSLGTFYPKDSNDVVYPYDRGTNFGKIKEAYNYTRSYNNELCNYLIMANGTVKKQTGKDNDTFTTLPNLTGIVKMAGEYFLRANGDCFSESGVLVATNVSLLGQNPITSRERITLDDDTDIYYDIFILNDGSIYATNPTNTWPHYVYEQYYNYDASGNHTGGPYYRKTTGAKCKVGNYILKTNGDLVEMVRYGVKNEQFFIRENLWSGYFNYIFKIATGVSSLNQLGGIYMMTMTNGTKKFMYYEKRPQYNKYGDFSHFSYALSSPIDVTGPENDSLAHYTYLDGWGNGGEILHTSDGKLRYRGLYESSTMTFDALINSYVKLTNIKSFDGRVALTNDGKAYYLSNYGSTGCTLTLLNINNVDKIVTREYTDLSNYNYLKKYITYILTKDNLLYALGGSKYGQAGIISGQINTPTIPNKPNVSLTQPTLNYLMLRDVLNLFPDSRYYSTGQYTQALNDLLAIYTGDTTYTSNYILVNDEVSFTTAYSDYENDIKYAEAWKFLHEPYWFDNSMGFATFHGQTLTAPVTKYDKKGRYTINLRARDNPKNDLKFKNDTSEAYNYYKWSTGNQNALLYVHERPIALARVTIANNGNGTYTVKALDAGSYDPDHSNSRADKGIAAREWRWKELTSAAWTAGQMNKADCTADKSYIIQLRVKDIEGVWSDYYTITIDKDNPPVALFNLDKAMISTTDLLKVKDQSYPQSFSTITNWHWIVSKVNANGTETNIYTKNATESNTGTGSLAGYDKHVKYSYNSIGKYRIYLRVKNSDGLWSDGGTDGGYNLSSFYSRDFEVDSLPTASFSIEKSPIYVEEVLKLKDLSVATGTSHLAKWHWVVKKLNPDGGVPSGNIQDAMFLDSNTGTGDMAGYDVNVKTVYGDKGPGIYRIYLRVMNRNGMWSDGGSDSSYNLNSMYYEDLEVQESFKMSGFRVVMIRDLHLEPYYNVNGKYPDKAMNVNSMSIDSSNFIVGGFSVVPGFNSLTKGYLFEFEIDTKNFNDENDTVEIEPSFYSYTPGVPGIRGPQSDLYWEDSNKEVHKAGEGGHSNWARIVLNESNRTITGENDAIWRGEYLIPATSWLVPFGTVEANAKSSKINADIIVNFVIKGYKDGEEKYDYNEMQWPEERTEIKNPYEIGDVIRYDYTKSSLDDIDIIINRP